jgi:hypothetical protein
MRLGYSGTKIIQIFIVTNKRGYVVRRCVFVIGLLILVYSEIPTHDAICMNFSRSLPKAISRFFRQF